MRLMTALHSVTLRAATMFDPMHSMDVHARHGSVDTRVNARLRQT